MSKHARCLRLFRSNSAWHPDYLKAKLSILIYNFFELHHKMTLPQMHLCHSYCYDVYIDAEINHIKM
jgi:hypothetical protein